MKGQSDKRAAGQPVRCAIYTRKSTEHGLELEFNSLDAQREACEAYIKSQASEHWQVLPDPYNDPAYSGGNMERPALKRLLKDIEAGKIDVVVVYKIDRLTRALADFAKLVEIFDARKVSFVAVTQQFSTVTSMGRLTLNVLLSFAQFERELASERVKDKVAASRKKGKWMGGSVPLGYDAVDKKLIINPAEATTVRMIFERYLVLKSIFKLMDELNSNGIISKKRKVKGKHAGGTPFTYGALVYLLKNRTYLGEAGHGGKWYDGEHAPIMDHRTFQDAQNLMKDNTAARADKRYRSGALLTGLIYDDRGNRMSPTYSVKNGVRYPFYVSSAILKGKRASAGSMPRVSAIAAEAAVFKVLNLNTSNEPEDSNRAHMSAMIETVVVTKSGLTLVRLNGQLPKQIELNWKDENIYGSAEQSTPIEDAPQGQALIHAIVRAHHWVEALSTRKFESVEKMAENEGIHPKVLRHRIRLAFIAPNLVDQALCGALVGLRKLDEAVNLSWQKQ